jgi:addiction module HigA family antidote
MSGNPLLAGLRPTHPGEILREDVLPALGLPEEEVARRLHVSSQDLHAIISEKQPVGPAMALRLARFLGNSPEFWLNLQRDYDVATLSSAMGHELAAIDPVAA